MTQLSEYGAYHRVTQEPVQFEGGGVPLRTSGPIGKHRRSNSGLRRGVTVFVAAALAVLLVAIPALLRTPSDTDPAADTAPVEVPSTVTETTVPAIKSPVDQAPGSEVHVLRDGSAVALVAGSVWRTVDNGQVWSEWYTDGEQEIEHLAIANDGAILAIRNPNATSDALGDGSTVNGTPEVHRYDPDTRAWSVIQLPRPNLPASDLAPQEENAGGCDLFGLQSWVDGSGIAVGDGVVILGDQRVVADGICDEGFQFLWRSPDGIQWQLVPQTGVNGYLAEIIWTGDGYVGYGSPRQSYTDLADVSPKVWTTTDLVSWEEAAIETSSIPEDSFVVFMPRVSDGSTGLSLTFDVMRWLSGLDSSTDLEDLQEWAIRGGWSAESAARDLEGQLEMIGIDLPLDDAEIAEVQSFLSMMEPYGTLTLTSSDGSDWEAVYTP